jgi:hypothetical protein
MLACCSLPRVQMARRQDPGRRVHARQARAGQSLHDAGLMVFEDFAARFVSCWLGSCLQVYGEPRPAPEAVLLGDASDEESDGGGKSKQSPAKPKVMLSPVKSKPGKAAAAAAAGSSGKEAKAESKSSEAKSEDSRDLRAFGVPHSLVRLSPVSVSSACSYSLCGLQQTKSLSPDEVNAVAFMKGFEHRAATGKTFDFYNESLVPWEGIGSRCLFDLVRGETDFASLADVYRSVCSRSRRPITACFWRLRTPRTGPIAKW